MVTTESGPRAWLGALVAGLLLTAGLPPFGWWPLSLMGSGLLAFLLIEPGRGTRRRGAIGLVAGISFLGPGLYWMAEFSFPGYVLAVLVETALFALGLMVVPTRWQWLGYPAGLVVAEAVRGAWPFGGVPIATLAQTQLGGPLVLSARTGGALMVAALVGGAGIALAATLDRRWRSAALTLVVVGAAVAGSFAAPNGSAESTLEAALVQGGGPRGTRASDIPAQEVYAAHLATSLPLADQPDSELDLVLWPEDVIDVDSAFSADSAPAAEVGELSEQLGATFVVGVIETEGDRFRNAAVAVGPDGAIADRYEKNQRVPFGEYIPWRSLIDDVADVGAVPRDAIAGHGPAILSTPAGELGVLISYEVFFAERADSAVSNGAQVLLVPTNASSFSTSQMPALELGAARLRAIETGRFVLQAAPTGFSAMIDPHGQVRQQSDLGDRVVLEAEVAMRSGSTLYSRVGDGPLLAAAVAALSFAWTSVKLNSRRSRRRS